MKLGHGWAWPGFIDIFECSVGLNREIRERYRRVTAVYGRRKSGFLAHLARVWPKFENKSGPRKTLIE